MAPADVVAVRPYLRLARVPTAGFTASIVLWGYFAARHDAGLSLSGVWLTPEVIGLASCGVLAHVFGSVDNEVCDREIDSRVPYLSAKPLVSGQVSLASARRGAAAALVVGLACAAAVASFTDPAVLGLTALAASCAAAYNRRGKRVLGGEFLFGGSMALFTMAGAAAVGGLPSSSQGTAACLALLAFLSLSFQVLFTGGLKDLETDQASGLHTVVGRLRTGATDTPSAQPYVLAAGAALLSVIGAAAALSALYVIPPGGAGGLIGIQLAVIGLFTGIRLGVLRRALTASDRRGRVRLLAVGEALQLPVFFVLLAGAMTFEAFAILFALPVAAVVLLNRAIYQTIAAPDV